MVLRRIILETSLISYIFPTHTTKLFQEIELQLEHGNRSQAERVRLYCSGNWFENHHEIIGMDKIL